MNAVLHEITSRRLETISKVGISFGCVIPEVRKHALVQPDFSGGLVICEIKRGSPSEGLIKQIENTSEWVEEYFNSGASVVSVLTEENFFFGNLNDLSSLKEQFPDKCFLRKDFLQSKDEILVSYLVGADIVLLIAAILDDRSLLEMNQYAVELGLSVIIEVHNREELDRVLCLNPSIIGINSRNLDTFEIDRNYPHALKHLIDEKIKVIYESGIRDKYDSYFCGVSGFNGLLIGTSIVKSSSVKNSICEIIEGFKKGLDNQSNFFLKIFNNIYNQKKPFIKVCGITNADDAQLVIEKGADAIGFVIADSPRKMSTTSIKSVIRDVNSHVLKVAVVVDELDIQNAVYDYNEGLIDVIQYHGDISNEQAYEIGIPWYKAIRVKYAESVIHSYRCPIVLFDAFDKEAQGGTGKRIDKDIISIILRTSKPVCLAGGINPDNIIEIMTNYRPDFIDLSSGLEQSICKKDKNKVDDFFSKIKSINE